VVEAVKFAPQAMLGALFPMLMRLRAGHRRTAPTGGLTGWTLALCAAAAAALTLAAGPLIALVFGERYAPSVGAVQILAWTLVPYALTANLSLRMVTEGREWAVLAATAGALATALLFFWLLVPRFGLTGACWAALSSEVAQAALFVMVMRRRSRTVQVAEYGSVT
jgi:O-antigen/teichoic acid export membrane protein